MGISFTTTVDWPTSKGVYGIFCKETNKWYIGHTFGRNGMKGRWYTHRNKLENNRHPNRYLQASFNKYGATNFSFVVLEIVEDISVILKKEAYYIFEYRANEREFGFNLDLPGDTKILKSEETIAKIKRALANKGQHRGPLTEKTKVKISKAHIGLKLPKEAIEARLETIKDKPLVDLVCASCLAHFKAKFKRKIAECPRCKNKRYCKKQRANNREKIAISQKNSYLKNREYYLTKAIRKYACELSQDAPPPRVYPRGTYLRPGAEPPAGRSTYA